MTKCQLCNNVIGNGERTVVPTDRGRKKICQASKQRGDNIVLSAGESVHEQCRRKYTNIHYIRAHLRGQAKAQKPKPVFLRSKYTFDFKHNCFLCGTKIKKSKRGPRVCTVRTLELQCSVAEAIWARKYEWGQQVKSRRVC